MADEDDELDSATDADTDQSSDSSDDSDSGPPPPPAQAVKDPTVRQYLSDKLAAAQDQANQNQLITGLGRAGASLSAGLAHSNQPVNQAPFDAMAASDQAPVTNVLNAQKAQTQDIANQKAISSADPDSAQSVAARSMIKKLYPGKFSDDDLNGLSADEIGDSIMKPLELDEKIQAHKDEVTSKNADRAQGAADRASAKRDKDQDAALKDVSALLESARGNPAAAQAERDIYASQKAKTLANMYGDPDKLSMPQVQLLASEIAKIAQGGAPSMHELDGLTPSTLMGKLSTVASSLINSPTAAHAADFVKQYQDYADGVTKDAQKVIEDKYGRVIETNRGRLGEDNYQRLQDNYVRRFQNSSEDSQPANDHPSRAAAILAQRQSAKAGQQTIQNAMPDTAAPQPGAPPAALAAPGFAFGGTVAPSPPGFAHVRQSPLPHLPQMKAPHAPKAPKEVMPAQFKPMTQPAGFACGGTVHNYEQGGTVPGQPKVPFNSPTNDTVTAKLTPKEEVLPLTVTQSKAPALAAYLHMRSKGYK